MAPLPGAPDASVLSTAWLRLLRLRHPSGIPTYPPTPPQGRAGGRGGGRGGAGGGAPARGAPPRSRPTAGPRPRPGPQRRGTTARAREATPRLPAQAPPCFPTRPRRRFFPSPGRRSPGSGAGRKAPVGGATGASRRLGAGPRRLAAFGGGAGPAGRFRFRLRGKGRGRRGGGRVWGRRGVRGGCGELGEAACAPGRLPGPLRSPVFSARASGGPRGEASAAGPRAEPGVRGQGRGGSGWSRGRGATAECRPEEPRRWGSGGRARSGPRRGLSGAGWAPGLPGEAPVVSEEIVFRELSPAGAVRCLVESCPRFWPRLASSRSRSCGLSEAPGDLPPLGGRRGGLSPAPEGAAASVGSVARAADGRASWAPRGRGRLAAELPPAGLAACLLELLLKAPSHLDWRKEAPGFHGERGQGIVQKGGLAGSARWTAGPRSSPGCASCGRAGALKARGCFQAGSGLQSAQLSRRRLFLLCFLRKPARLSLLEGF